MRELWRATRLAACRLGGVIVGTVDVRFLQILPYFQDLSLGELALIRSQVQQRNLEAGELILLAGQPAEALYAVRRGRARIFVSSAGGKEQVLFVVDRGATFNDTAVFDGGLNQASAQALGPGACIYVLPAPLMTHLAATNPRVAAAVIRVMSSRVRHLATLVEDLSLQHLTQRVAKLLLCESTSMGIVTLTKQDIAARVGTVREVVSRELRHLEQAGAIARGREGVVRVDPPALRALLGSSVVEMPAPEERIRRLAAS
ncbi:MAG: Crp/Fnr family transcriptional regulator [Chloroflexota bacterium]